MKTNENIKAQHCTALCQGYPSVIGGFSLQQTVKLCNFWLSWTVDLKCYGIPFPMVHSFNTCNAADNGWYNGRHWYVLGDGYNLLKNTLVWLGYIGTGICTASCLFLIGITVAVSSFYPSIHNLLSKHKYLYQIWALLVFPLYYANMKCLLISGHDYNCSRLLQVI